MNDWKETPNNSAIKPLRFSYTASMVDPDIRIEDEQTLINKEERRQLELKKLRDEGAKRL